MSDYTNDEFEIEGEQYKQDDYAGFWIRVGATLVDFLALLPLTAFAVYNSISIKSLPLLILASILSAMYKPIMEWQKSATLGKMALGLKVVNVEDGASISLGQSLNRYFPWIISFAISLSLNIFLFLDPSFQDITGFIELSKLTSENPLNTINTVYSFIFIGVVGSLAFDNRKQGLHDKFAGTYVVKVK